MKSMKSKNYILIAGIDIQNGRAVEVQSKLYEDGSMYVFKEKQYKTNMPDGAFVAVEGENKITRIT